MKWFQHQSRAHSDSKLQKVLMKYGFEGYGLYWYCIESICANLEPTLNFDLEHDSEILAHVGKIDSRRVEEMMLYMVNIGLFQSSEGVIVCRKLARYLGDNLTRNTELKKIIQAEKGSNTHTVSETASDSLRLSQQEERRGEERTGEKDKTSMSSSSKTDRAPIAKIVDAYHKILPNHPAVKKLTTARESQIKQRWREDLPELTNWENFFDYVAQSPFLTGRVHRDDRRPFVADLEWLTKASNYTKILEGKYHGI